MVGGKMSTKYSVPSTQYSEKTLRFTCRIASRTLLHTAYCVLRTPYFLLCIGLSLCTDSAAADRLVLRNLKIITDRNVAAFDEDGLRLDDNRVVTWDEIERGTIAGDKQAAFDASLRELGEPLFRVRQRLKVGDYEGALTPAETLFPRYTNRRSNSAYLVVQAVMWGRIAAGKREGAVEPYLYCLECLRGKKKEEITLPGDRRLKFDEQTGYSPELPPVWFDAAAAKQVLPAVLKAAGAVREPRPEAARIYYVSLALAAGDTDTANKSLRGVTGQQSLVTELREILLAEQEVLAGKPGEATNRLQWMNQRMSPTTKPIALYWLGRAKLLADDENSQREGVLQLLHLPALYGSAYPDLAGAALFESMNALEKLSDMPGSIALRKELLQKFGQTVHAARVRKETR